MRNIINVLNKHLSNKNTNEQISIPYDMALEIVKILQYVEKERQRNLLIELMRGDEELGLYDNEK